MRARKCETQTTTCLNATELPSQAVNLTAPVSFLTYENVLKQHHKSLWLFFSCYQQNLRPVSRERERESCSLQSKHVIFATTHWHGTQLRHNLQPVLHSFHTPNNTDRIAWTALNAWFACRQLPYQNTHQRQACAVWSQVRLPKKKTHLNCIYVTALACTKVWGGNKITVRTIKYEVTLFGDKRRFYKQRLTVGVNQCRVWQPDSPGWTLHANNK